MKKITQEKERESIVDNYDVCIYIQIYGKYINIELLSEKNIYAKHTHARARAQRKRERARERN